MLMRLTRPWPVLCFACIGILGVLLLADITTRLAMIAAGPASSQRLQGSHPFWLPWLQTRLAHATGYPTQPSLDEFLQVSCWNWLVLQGMHIVWVKHSVLRLSSTIVLDTAA